MIEIKFNRKNGESHLLSLPCALPELIQGSMPFLISYGEAEITFQTGSESLNEALKKQLFDIGTSVKNYIMLAQMLEELDDQGKENLAENLMGNPYKLGFEDVLQAAVKQASHWHYPEGQYRRWFNREAEAMRLTGGELFEKIVELAKENGDWERFGRIEDYTLPGDDDVTQIANFQFNLCAVTDFGSSEGIYVDCFIRGDFGSYKDTLPLGTMKTLSTDLDACKVMGELCGVLLYHENRYVNQNLHLFMPEKEIEGILTRPLTLRQAQEMEQTQPFPEMTM